MWAEALFRAKLAADYFSAATSAVLSAAAAVLSWQQAAESFWQHAGASASVFSVLALLPEQATSIAATAAIANRFFIIVYLINVVVVFLVVPFRRRRKVKPCFHFMNYMGVKNVLKNQNSLSYSHNTL